MNKSKYFQYILIAKIVLLFIFGNWVTTAQATGMGVVDATPMPTIMPTEPLLGVIPSAEEQEELKAVVQSYFEIRYRARSVSQAEDFKQNNFGSLISNIREAKTFLPGELGKLAVEIKHAELNRLRYIDYKYFLDFHSFVTDPSIGTVTVSVIEGNEVIYELSHEINPEDPTISRHSGIEHTLVLHKEQGQWKIISDHYNDYLWRMLRQTGKSTDELLHTMDVLPENSVQQNVTTLIPTPTLPVDSSTHPYDRAGAVEYALSYWSVYNRDYPDYNSTEPRWGDCTNFVSQAIYEGGNASMAIPNTLPQPGVETVGWYLLNDMQRATAWNDVEKFHEFVLDPVSTPSAGWSDGPEGYEVGIDQLWPGDVIQYDWDGINGWDHAVIVVFISNGIPYVAGHSDDVESEPYTSFDSYDPNKSQIRFIHIERSDGYPPVKAQIEPDTQQETASHESSNDAGPNPLSPSNCGFTIGDNELYFGICQDRSPIASGFRFKNVEVPQGAQIKYAYLTFSVDGPFSESLSMSIYGDSATNSDNFAVSQPKERLSLTAPVMWHIGSSENPDTWNLGERRTTPNLSTIVQSIVGIPGWQYGNPLSFIFKDPVFEDQNATYQDSRRVISFERANHSASDTLFPAKLIAAYTMEGAATTGPTVYSITRFSPSPTNASTVGFQVIFSEPVTGVDSEDFSLSTTGVANTAITSVSQAGDRPGDTYHVIVNTGDGDGKIRLDVKGNASIQSQDDGQQLNGGFTSGEAYTIDKTAPSVNSINLTSPNPSNAAVVDFAVIFSEIVNGVDADDFTLDTSGVTGAFVTEVTRLSGTEYHVTVNTGQGDGDIRLKVVANTTIKDRATNVMNGERTSNPYTIDKTPPAVSSSAPASVTSGGAVNANFEVVFSKSVMSVDAADFTLTTTNAPGAAISSVSGSGTTYTVSVNIGTGDGTIRLDVRDDATILDLTGNPLSGGFTGGETYTIPKCNLVTHSPVALSGSTMSMTITNPTNMAFELEDVFVRWDHDRGHAVGLDKSLILQQAALGSTPLWSGSQAGPTYTFATNATLPAGTSTMTFTFHQSYDRSDGSENIRINLATDGCQAYSIDSDNLLTQTPGAKIDTFIGGVQQGNDFVANNTSQQRSYAGVNTGPVEIVSTNAVPVIASARVIYKVNNVNTSFSEMMALPANRRSTTYWLPWYNNVDLDTQLRFGNTYGKTVSVHVYIAGQEMAGSPFTLADNTSLRVSFPGINNGPVKIVSTGNITASQRIIYTVNGVETSYSEMMALPNGALDTTFWLPWYNNVDLDTQLRFANASSSMATVRVYIGGTEMTGSPFTLASGASIRQSFTGINNGPVKIVSNVNIVASQRVIYNINGANTSFAETMALPNSQLDTTYWMPWYNNVDLDTQLRIANVTDTPATVHVYVEGVEMTDSPLTLAPGESIRKSFAGINSGQVKIASNVNIVVSQRVICKVNGVNTSFSEMLALPDKLLDTIYLMPWYNNFDFDTQLRFGVP